MKRARLLITEILITRRGEIKHVQIKLPKNVTRILAVDTDARMISRLIENEEEPMEEEPIKQPPIKQIPNQEP